MCVNCFQSEYRKKFFADFMAREDAASYVQYKDKKQQIFKNVNGNVLELGPGTGVNFRFFPKDIKWFGVEPNPAMHPYLKKEGQKSGIEIDLRANVSEHMEFEDNSMDFVISTIVLCSVNSIKDTLDEVLRVLKPGGQFLFIEHQIDDPWTIRRGIQKIVPYTPWRYFSDGCFPDREIGKRIDEAGFEEVSYTKYKQEGPGLILAINRSHIYGWARKREDRVLKNLE